MVIIRENVIMCCVVRAIEEFRQWWNGDHLGERILLQCKVGTMRKLMRPCVHVVLNLQSRHASIRISTIHT
jgi:hypothetical protein